MMALMTMASTKTADNNNNGLMSTTDNGFDL